MAHALFVMCVTPIAGVTSLQEEDMGQKDLRLEVWALAVLTCFTLFGAHTAYAWNNQPRVMAGGWFFDPNSFAGAKVNIGLTGRCSDAGFTSTPNTGPPTFSPSEKCSQPKGHFEYHNHGSGLKANGKIASLTFEPVFATDQCAIDGLGGDHNLAGQPAAHITGTCDDGSCTFDIKVVDGFDSTPQKQDWVCNVHVHDSTHTPDDFFGAPLIKGHVEIKNYP